jgi:3-methyladenine DNA glycosylase AlkD
MTITNKIHKQILKKFKEYKINADQKESQWVQHYLGSNKPTQCFKTRDIQEITKEIIKKNNFNEEKLIDLLNSLYQNATTFNEIDIAGRLIGLLSNLRRNLDPFLLDNWLNYTYGWAETDLLCQSNFTSEELLSNWSVWEKLLRKFSKDKNIHKRRASIVLLTKSLRQTDDQIFSKLAFENIEKLKSEKEILITKAVSWGLRALVKFHKDEVLKYLEENKDSLSKIAYREALTKVQTGKKYNRIK